ncbi:MAG: c-type cytochrome [Campylobacterales bacterium]|nr:c-type cytochrome [Campylobacterales bacterium]MBN2831866.1 c-type cytochrome [Campylobacterales bacterium]
MTQRIWISFVISLLFHSFLNAQEDGKVLYAQCAGCHGQDGKNKAFGRSGIIAGQSVKDLIESLKFYRESEFKAHGTSLVMAKQTKTMRDQDINAVAQYISKLPK